MSRVVPTLLTLLAGLFTGPLVGLAGSVALAEPPPAIDALRQTVEARAETGWFSGTVAAAWQGEVVYHAAHGNADRRRQLPMQLDTPINLGSTPKLFTAVAIAQLKLAGKLDYEDPLVEHLPELKARTSGELTLAHLLSHTSGLSDFFSPAYRSQLSAAEHNHDLYELSASLEPREEPGGDMRYTNANFVILGEVIERVSGQRFERYLAEHVFGPASMSETRMIRAGDRQAGKIAINYATLPGQQAMRLMGDRELAKQFRAESEAAAPTEAFVHEAPSFGGGMVANGAGGAYSTSGDMLRFAKALRNGTLIPWSELEYLCTSRSSPRRMGTYGLGCIATGEGRAHAIGHGGGAIGMQTWFLMYTDLPLDMVVMTNHHRQADPIRQALADALIDTPAEAEKPAAP